jgi:hypothetical protein
MGTKQEDVYGLPDEVSTAQCFELIVVDLDSLSAVASMKTTMMRMIGLSRYPMVLSSLSQTKNRSRRTAD